MNQVVASLAPNEGASRLAPRNFVDDKVVYALVGLITLGLVLSLAGPLSPDVSGQFWHAHSMRHGARLYLDVEEINPPLWFWMAMPIDWLAETFALRSQPITIAAVGILVLAATAGTGRMLIAVDRRRRIAFTAYVVLILLVMPARALEQREHLALIATVPYLVLAGLRRGGAAVSPWLALAIGVCAGVGLSLKPYFLLVPLLVEAWLFCSLRSKWRPFRAETLGLATIVTAYVVVMLVTTSAYFQVQVPMLLIGYDGVGPTLWDTLGFLPLIWLVTIAVTLSQLRSSRFVAAPTTIAVLIGACAFAVGWAMQHKGWLYHGIPTTGCCAVALAAALMETGAPADRFVRICAPALLFCPLWLALVNVNTKITPDNDIAPALEGLQRGDSFGWISTEGATSWPAMLGRGLRLASRHGQYWMIHAIDQRPSDPAVGALMTRVIRETAFDYRCLPPKVIIFFDLKSKAPINVKRGRIAYSTHPFPLFARDPDFTDVLRHYRLWRSGPVYEAWRQVSPLEPVDPARCRRPG